MSFNDFCVKHGFESKKRIYLFPHIPAKILKNAQASFGVGSTSNEILASIDNTVFGSGKEGCIILHDRIIFKQSFEDAREHLFSGIVSIESDGETVFLNDRKIFKFHMPEKDNVADFFRLVSAWISDHEANIEVVSDDKANEKKIREIQAGWIAELSKKELDIYHQAIYVAPEIPIKKLRGAIASFGDWIEPKDILVLIDDTVFGGAKEGVIITEKKIAMKAIMDSPRLFFWKNIEKISIRKKKVYINDREIISLTQLGEKELGNYFNKVSEHLLMENNKRNKSFVDVEMSSEDESDQVVETTTHTLHLTSDKSKASVQAGTHIKSHHQTQTPEATQVENTGEAIQLEPDEKNKQIKTCREESLLAQTEGEIIETNELAESAVETNSSNSKQSNSKLVGYATEAIESNWSKISPYLIEKTGEISINALNNDANIERLGSVIYALLPGVVRFAVREEVFITFLLNNRDKILSDKLKYLVEEKRAESIPLKKPLEGQPPSNNSFFSLDLERSKVRIENELKPRLKSSAKGQDRKEYADLLFYIKIMEAALKFPGFAAKNIDATITETEKSALESDETIATTIGYTIASMTYMLNTQAGFNQDQVYSVLEPIFRMGIVPYAEQANKNKPITLKSFASHESRLLESSETSRIKNVSHVLMQNIGNKDSSSLNGNYTDFIFKATEYFFADEESKLNFMGKMWGLGDGIVGRYLIETDERIERALIDYLSSLQSS